MSVVVYAARIACDLCGPGCASLSLAGILADIDDRAAQLKMRGQG